MSGNERSTRHKAKTNETSNKKHKSDLIVQIKTKRETLGFAGGSLTLLKIGVSLSITHLKRTSAEESLTEFAMNLRIEALFQPDVNHDQRHNKSSATVQTNIRHQHGIF
uniref:Uncharacterized protein n=1 Tax=Solanum lycopersicum TaxID=4081 RepID=A0A3Q7H970_SOLLC